MLFAWSCQSHFMVLSSACQDVINAKLLNSKWLDHMSEFLSENLHFPNSNMFQLNFDLHSKRKHLCSTFQSICCQWGLWMISFIKLKRAILANQIAFNWLATWESAGVTVVQDDWKLRSEKRLISLLLPPGKLAVVQDTAPPDRDNAARFSAEDSFDAHVVVDFSVAQIEKCGVFCSENHYLY